MEAILKLASFLLIEKLQELCIRFMEHSTDLTSFFRYFQLSVDYMVSGAEEVASEIIKSRFHDLFVFDDSTKKLSPCHLQKLFEDYDIFENCTMIDTFSFIVDWVTSGKSEDHVKLGMKILEAQFEQNSCFEEDRKSVEELQSDQEAGCDNEPTIKQKELNYPGCNCDQDPKSDLCPQPLYETGEKCSHQSSGTDNAKPSQSQTVNEIDEILCESQRIEESYTIETEPQNDDADEEFSDIRHPSLRKRMGLNIPQAVDIMKSKLESSNDLSEFTDKCKELIEKKFGSITRLDKTGYFAPTTNAFESDLSESDVDQVLIAVTPKKRLKDFLADSERGYQCEVSLEKEEAIFDICVYVPRSQSWFCFGEGTNCGIFKEIGQKNPIGR